jgi:hypothetical protein
MNPWFVLGILLLFVISYVLYREAKGLDWADEEEE